MSKEYRGLGHEVKEHTPSRPTKIHLLAIGIDHYKYNTNWPALTYPVKDCQRLAKALHDRYALVSSKTLLNEEATVDNVLEAMDKMTSCDEQGHPHIGADESLVVYFAGHGYRSANKQQNIKDSDKGALVLYDSDDVTKNNDPGSQLLDFEKLAEWLGKSQAGHILLVLDTCFGGLFQDLQVNLPPELIPMATANDIHTPSRWVLTSGRWEPVPDKSHFTEVLIELLRTNKDKRISIDSLYGKLRDKITTFNELQSVRPTIPIPYCRNLVRRMDGGDFFLELNRETHELVVERKSQSLSETLRKRSATYRESLMKGRFRYLRIEQVLLPGTSLPPLLEVEVSLNQKHSYLKQALDSLWNQEKRQAVLLGNGGTGKTVSLLNIWEELLSNQNGTIPVYIPLNAYNMAREDQQSYFVFRYIVQHYLGEAEPTAESINQLRDFFHLQKDGSKSPSLVLLLDGYNEITAGDKSRLDIELRQLYESSPQVQWVITSRYVEITNFEWTRQSEVLELQTLSRETAQFYLDQTNTIHPENEDAWELLRNPMALTCYVGTESVRREFTGDDEFKFFEVKKFAKLIWNFQEVQLAQAKKRKSTEREYVYSVFLIRYLLPYIAWRMEKGGHYFIPLKRNGESKFYLKQVVEDWVETGITDGFIEEFPAFPLISGDLNLDFESKLAPAMRNQKIRETLLFQLKAMVQEGDELGFLHQNFRDFYAACHLLNCVKFALAEGKRPPEWKERTFPVYLRRMIGELEGEYEFDPHKLLEVEEAKRERLRRIAGNQLTRLMDCCRGPKDMTGDYTVWNLVTILHESRGTLAGADLSKIDFRNVTVNGISLSLNNGKKYLAITNLEGARVEGEQFLFNGHTDLVRSAVYSPDGGKILSASWDKTIREWSVDTGKCIRIFEGHTDGVKSAVYHPDGRKILSASWDGTVREWSVDTKECIQILKGHTDGVTSAIYRPDSRRILSASLDNSIREWSTRTGECIQILKGHTNKFDSTTLSPFAQGIISARYNDIKEWGTQVEGDANWIVFADYCPNGQKILFVSRDNTIREWSIQTRKYSQTIDGHTKEINSAVYSADGRRILSASCDNTIREWSVATGKCITIFGGHTDEVYSAVYSPDGQKILSTSRDKTIREWSVDTKECMQILRGHTDGVFMAVYSPDSQKILSVSKDGLMEWSVKRGECLQKFIVRSNVVTSANYSPNGQRILSTSCDNTIREWSIQTEKCLQIFKEHTDGVVSAVYNPDGQKVLSAFRNGTIRELSVNTRECLKTLNGHTDWVIRVEYSPDGKKILSASHDNTIKEWSSKTGDCLQVIHTYTRNITSLDFSSDGQRVISNGNDNNLREWSAQTGECLRVLSGHTGKVTYTAYSPDGQKILSASRDKNLREWSAQTGKCLRVIEAHNGEIHSAIYSPNGQEILSTAADGIIMEWSAKTMKPTRKYINEPGLYIQGLDLRNLHPDSVFTEKEKERMRRYGAIFDDQDKADWEAAVEDAYGKE
jgi:WD40 repeat protein